MSPDHPAVSDIALDFDFGSNSFDQFVFEAPGELVDRYLADLREECRALGKDGPDKESEARSGVVVAAVRLCRRDFAGLTSRCRSSWSTT